MTDLFGAVCPCCGQPAPNVEATPFDAFWKAWPDRRNRAAAQKAFANLSPAERKVATDRAAAWCERWRKQNPNASHIMASTYINQRRFLDEGTQADPEARDRLLGEWIRDGKKHLLTSVSPSWARDLVAGGHCTEDEARRAGVL